MQNASAQSAAANYQAQVSLNNATIAQQNAQLAAQTGEAKAEATSLQNREQIGRIAAAQAAGGIDVDSGSAVDVRSTQREMGRLSQLTDVSNAALQQYGYRSQGTSYQAQAGLETAQAASAARAGPIAAAGSLLGGAGSALSRFSWMQTNAGGGGAGVDPYAINAAPFTS
jgi:hypothetical protein